MTNIDLMKVYMRTNNSSIGDKNFAHDYAVWLESLCILLIPVDAINLEGYIRQQLIKQCEL